jgi:hypothetical protein
LTGSDPYLSTVIGFVLGFVSAVLTAIIIKMITEWYTQPVLAIWGNDGIIVATFQMHRHGKPGHVTYYGNRITVENTGRSAAKDCKVYIDYQGRTQRVAWLFPDKNSGYTLTLNVRDKEFVDFCAISEVEHTRIIPPEQGFINEFENEYANRLGPNTGDLDLVIRISSSNAKPVERQVTLHADFNTFPNSPGRIVEFAQEIHQLHDPQGWENN